MDYEFNRRVWKSSSRVKGRPGRCEPHIFEDAVGKGSRYSQLAVQLPPRGSCSCEVTQFCLSSKFCLTSSWNSPPLDLKEWLVSGPTTAGLCSKGPTGKARNREGTWSHFTPESLLLNATKSHHPAHLIIGFWESRDEANGLQYPCNWDEEIKKIYSAFNLISLHCYVLLYIL